MAQKWFYNTTTLARFIWRRDQVRIPIWIISIVLVSIAVAMSFPSLYPAGPERLIIAQTLKNPAMISMIGPGYGMDNYHIGAIMAHQMLLFTAVTVAIMNIFLTIRNTRSDEEQGRIEVIRSLPVGRLSSAAATMLVLFLTNLSLGVLTALGLGILGLEGMDWTGSILYGAVLGTVGIFFASVTLLLAQLTETARAALGYAFSFLGAAYLIRAIGDISSETLARLSPLGLILRTQVYVKNYWWPIWVVLSLTIIATLVALRFNASRDLQAALVSSRPGRQHASSLLRSPLGLVLRLERTTIMGWSVGIFVLGASYGSVFGDVDSFFNTSDLYQKILPMIEGFSLTDQFVATLLSIMSMMAAIPSLLVMLRLRAEEGKNRVEHLLARAVSRTRLLSSFLVIAMLVAVVMQIISILGLWSAAVMSVSAEPFSLVETLQGGLMYIPVMWILLGLAVVLIGFAPRSASAVWLYLGYSFFTVYLGGILQLPDWMAKLTPWGYVPNVPLEPMKASTVVISLLVAFSLMGLGIYGYNKRDIQG
ncbi:MAG: ABC transporter permease [Firmicutes bacterium]|nr:ABC transporter permease [Bacillota bacterium]